MGGAGNAEIDGSNPTRCDGKENTSENDVAAVINMDGAMMI